MSVSQDPTQPGDFPNPLNGDSDTFEEVILEPLLTPEPDVELSFSSEGSFTPPAEGQFSSPTASEGVGSAPEPVGFSSPGGGTFTPPGASTSPVAADGATSPAPGPSSAGTAPAKQAPEVPPVPFAQPRAETAATPQASAPPTSAGPGAARPSSAPVRPNASTGSTPTNPWDRAKDAAQLRDAARGAGPVSAGLGGKVADAAKSMGSNGAAANAAKTTAPIAPPKKPQNTTAQSRVGRAAEQRGRQLANAAAQAAAASTGVGAVGAKVAGQVADKVVGQGIKVAAAAASITGMVLIAVLFGGFVMAGSFNGHVPGAFPLPAEPRQEQTEAIPPNWAKVSFNAQQRTKSRKFGIPWTVLAGLLKVQSDFGRTAPYDTIDRDPDRDPKYGPAPGMQGSSGALVSAESYSGPVYVLGGVLTEGIRTTLPTRLTNTVTIDSAASRSTADAVASLASKKGTLPGALVVDLGATEPTSAAAYTKHINAVMSVAGENTAVYWFNVHNKATPAIATAVNSSLSAATSRYTNLTILDWATAAKDNPAWVSNDRVRPTDQGYQQRSRLIADAISGAGSSTGFQNPLKKGTYTLTSPFGMRMHPIKHRMILHGGLDFAAAGGTPIYAANSGTVASAGFNTGGFGNLTIIKHADGIETYYAHQSAISVTAGDKVTAGQPIGKVGTTGSSTGNHLHFEVHVAGTKQDPAKYLPGGANGATTTATASGVASYTALTAGAVSAAADCVAPTASPAIGGRKAQAVGPFLLRPEHAAAMKDRGKDANNPCEAAEYVATKMVEAGKTLWETGKYSQWKDSDDAARKLWGDVIASSNLFADPNNGNTDCSVPTTGQLDVAYAIETIVSCEATRAKDINLAVSASVDDSGKVQFETTSRENSVAQLVNEALDVSFVFSRHLTDQCDNARPLTGLFPLTAATAAKFGATDRCDPQSDIRAAARALLAGESTNITDRSTAAGPYAPMIGGWANMPWALGRDAAVLSKRGPVVDWMSNASCDAAINAWLAAAVAKGVPTKGDLASFVAAVPGNPLASKACASPSPSSFAGQAALLAEAAGDQLAAPATDLGEAEPAPAPTVPTIDLGDLETAKRSSAYARLAAHFSNLGADTGREPAQAGTDSIVARLSPTGKTVPAGPRSQGTSSTFAFPTGPAALDYAVNYGGIRPQWDTFGTEVGVVGQIVGDAGAGFGTGGDASVVIAGAKKWLGTPYSWGGGDASGPTKGVDQGANTVGFDCSGLTEYAFAQAGYKIGGVTGEQEKKGVPVKSLADAQPGDLLFWGAPGSYHVAIYLGGNQMLHAPRTGDVVKISSVYRVSEVTIRRILKPSSGSANVPAGQWASKLPADGRQYAGLFQASGQKYRVEPQLLAAIAWQESTFLPDIVNCTRRSPVGAQGLMQFMPATAGSFGIDPCQPAQAADAAGRYISTLYKRFGSVPLAVAAYNAGEGNVAQYGGIPPFPETMNYAREVPQKCRSLGGRCS